MKLTRVIALAVLLAVFSAWPATAETVFKQVFDGITAAEASTPLPNIGQSLHLLTAIYSTATADVTGLEIRLEASFDGATYFAVSDDIETAEYAGGQATAMLRAHGSFPYIRARAVTTSATYPLDLHYTGSTYPLGNVTFKTDRWIAAAIGGGYTRATWVLCSGSGCATGTNLTNRYVVTSTASLAACYITAKTAPTGQALVVDINNATDGVSVFGAGNELELSAGATSPEFTTTFDNPSVDAGDVLTIDIDQVGSTAVGQDVTVTCTIQ